MEEWKEFKLGEVAIPVRDRIDTSVLDASSYISTENMLPDKAGVTLSSGIPSGKAIQFKDGDVLISNIRPYFKKIWRADKVGGCSADVICLRAANEIDPLFLYYLMSQDLFFDFVMQGAKGTKMPRGDRNQIMQWSVSLPSKSEQQKIASILSALDDKIEVNRRINDNFVIEKFFEILLIWMLTTPINDNLEQQAQALFKSWFVDFEPFKNGEFVESELGLIPKGWRVGCLDEIGDIFGGSTPSKSKPEYYTDRGIAWLTPKDLSVSNCKFTAKGEIDITQEGYNSCSTKLMPKGTVLFSSRAPIGYITIAKNNICTNQGFKSVVPKIAGTAFIYYFLKTSTKEIENKATGSTFKEASGALMKSLQLAIAPKTIFDVFEKALKPILSKQEVLEDESRRLATLRDTLLPKLMSGELKVFDKPNDQS